MPTNSAPAPKADASTTKSGESAKTISLLNAGIDTAKPEFFIHVNAWATGGIIALLLIAVLVRGRLWKRYKQLEIDEAEIGVGSGKVKLKPNLADRQVAYQIWVELSTRKLGLPIDLDHDVISETYDSWYNFFGVTRELVKSVPVSRVSDQSTQAIINMSIEVLNEGLRPHLTKWQARYRHWYERKLADTSNPAPEPQLLQKDFPAYAELSADLLAVNAKLTAYRRAMRSMVYGK